MSEPFLLNERLRLCGGMADQEQIFAASVPEIHKGTHCPNSTQTVTVCRSAVGIAVSLIEGIIATSRVLWMMNLSSVEVQEALKDMKGTYELEMLMTSETESPQGRMHDSCGEGEAMTNDPRVQTFHGYKFADYVQDQTEIAQLRTELDDSTETSRKAVELMADAVAEVVTLRAQLAEVTGEQDRLRAALVKIYATATRTLADPPCADMSALIRICTIFEALSAQPEPEAGSVQP